MAIALVPSILFSSCSPGDLFIGDDVKTINETEYPNSQNAVPIDFSFNSEDQQLLEFIAKLSNDIIENPLIAKQFSEDPQSIIDSYKITNLKIDFEDSFWKLIIALGETDLSEAIARNDISSFLSLCSEKGLIAEIKKSELIQYLNSIGPKDQEIVTRAGVMVAAIAGCAAGGAAAVVYYETYWWTDGTRSGVAMSERDAPVYQIWTLKKGTEENTHVMLFQYQEKIVNECIDGLQTYFPEHLEGVNMVELKKFISLNMPK